MRSPSSRVLSDVADWYPGALGQSDGGPTYTYSGIPARKAIACSAQAGEVMEEVDPQGRVTQVRMWKLFFAQPTNAAARDKFVVVDRYGTSHTLFAHVERDEAGRGSTFVVRCTEMI